MLRIRSSRWLAVLPGVLAVLTAMPVHARSEALLGRPGLSRQGEVLEYVSGEFRSLLQERPAECSAFLDLVEGRQQGPVSETEAARLEHFNTYGLLIARKDGTVLFEKYLQGSSPATRYKMFSISKMLTALSFGAMERAGKLSRDALVAPFLKARLEALGVHYPYWDQLRVRHLLTMSSGIPWCEYSSCSARDAIAGFFAPHSADAVKYYFENATRAASPMMPLVAPGERYAYSLGNATVLQSIFKSLLGKEYEEAAATLLFDHLDVKPEEYALEKDGQGVALGGSGAFLNLPTLAKLGLVLMNEGRYYGRQIANPEFVREMTTQILEPLRQSKDLHLKAWEGPTGMGVWLNSDEDPTIPSFMPDAPRNMVYSSGWQGRRLMLFPEAGDDGFLVARIGSENSHSSYWKPYSKQLYACLGRHPELTPRNRGTQEGALIATSAPVLSTKKQAREAGISIIKKNIPIQLAAAELCNCAYVSGFAVATDGKFDSKATLKRCLKLTQPDFSAVPWIFRPELTNRRVHFELVDGLKTVRVVLKTNPLMSYTAVAALKDESGACEVIRVPRETLIP